MLRPAPAVRRPHAGRRLLRSAVLLFLVVGTVPCVAAPEVASGHDLVCPPCGHACLETVYESPGDCPICGMRLVRRSEVEVRADGGAEIRGETPFTFRDVSWESGDVVIEGRLYLPAGVEPPFAAVVVNHGSAPTTFADVSFFSRTALEVGMAALAYSKRGCGGSTGEFRRFNVAESEEIFAELAQDAAAAVRWLSEQPEIDAGRVGFLGGSQAGWISPLAAGLQPVKFIFTVAGVPLAAGEEAHHEWLLGGGAGRTFTVEEADEALRDYDGPRGFDPRSLLIDLEADTFWLFGSADTVIPVRPSLEALEEIRRRNPRHVVELVDGYDHNMVHVETGRPYDTANRLRAWLSELGVLSSSPADGGREGLPSETPGF